MQRLRRARTCNGTGLLPGVLKVRRRAARLHRMLIERTGTRGRST